MAGNPIDYAEGTLGTEQVWVDYQAAFKEYEIIGSDVLEAHNLLRGAKTSLGDCELAVMTEVKGRPNITSNADYERQLKEALAEDEQCKNARLVVSSQQAGVLAAERSLAEAEWKLRGYVARMNELGGILNFYAARAPRPK